MKMPTFSEHSRDFPEFKKLWKMVDAEYDPPQSFHLLKNEALPVWFTDKIKICPDISAAWTKLNDEWWVIRDMTTTISRPIWRSHRRRAWRPVYAVCACRSSSAGPVWERFLIKNLMPGLVSWTGSLSTHLHIINNSSLNINRSGHSYNSILAKGPNNIHPSIPDPEKVFIWVLSKAYNQIVTGPEKNDMRRLVWRYGKEDDQWTLCQGSTSVVPSVPRINCEEAGAHLIFSETRLLPRRWETSVTSAGWGKPRPSHRS